MRSILVQHTILKKSELSIWGGVEPPFGYASGWSQCNF